MIFSTDLPPLDWDKAGGLLPAIIQDADSGEVLMLGYMNRQALEQTRASGRVTFWSRSKQRLWEKGESSGHFLALAAIAVDCDRDTLLVTARPAGPVCHLGTRTCFGADAPPAAGAPLRFLLTLDHLIGARAQAPERGSYTSQLLAAGARRIAQKVGEEAVELALAAVSQSDGDLIAEAADLTYHLLVLLAARGLSLGDVVAELDKRHRISLHAPRRSPGE